MWSPQYGRRFLPSLVFVGLLIAAALAAGGRSDARQQLDDVRVGMIQSLFEEKDEKAIFRQMEPFADLVRRRTGQKGEFVVVPDVTTMARDLKSGKIQMGVVHGFEVGWVREGCPDCQPLLIAVNDATSLKALLLVNKDSRANTVAELKGQALARARRPPKHTDFYLERLIEGEPDAYFKVQPFDNTDAAIEAVIDGQAQATVVSASALEAFKRRKPGRYNKLKVLTESPDFPAAALLYRPGQVKEATVKRFRETMLTADQTPEGRQTLTLWRLSGFQPVPRDYDKLVDETLKRYPSPTK